MRRRIIKVEIKHTKDGIITEMTRKMDMTAEELEKYKNWIDDLIDHSIRNIKEGSAE